MSRHSAFYSLMLAVMLGFTACNSSSEDEIEYEPPTSTLIKSFSLSANSKVLANLDKVFFSIDLNNASIFNADSLPYGTDVRKLVPVITTGGVSALDIIVKRPGQSDTTYNYLTNSTDSINFANGPVTLRLRSIDENATMSYTVKVNVHQVKSDSLAWGNAAYSALPTNLDEVFAQHTVKYQGRAYCLTSDGYAYCMSVSDNPATQRWQNNTVTFDFQPLVESLRSTTDALYILSYGSDLYKSTDGGLSWTETGIKLDNVIGGYGSDLLGTVETEEGWFIVSTSGRKWEAADNFPVSGMSIPIEYHFSMSDAGQITIVGGRTAEGELIGDCWGFDGKDWACLSNSPLPVKLEEAIVFPYFIFAENSFFIATKSSIFVAFGGKTESGDNNNVVYISYNYGMTWQKASEEMQLPEDVPAMYQAQALIFNQEYQDSNAQVSQKWQSIATSPIPGTWTCMNTSVPSRVSEAITSWECPFVYVFGGYDKNDMPCNTIWRAVVNRFMFKPIQ